MDSPLPRSSESESTGYSTDYSTFEVTRQNRRSSVGVPIGTLPNRSLREGSYSSYPRRARPSVTDGDREECQELLGGNASRALAQTAALARRSHIVIVGGDDAVGREEEEEDVMRDDPKCCPASINCSLVPSCAIHRWKLCRICYCVWICVLLSAIAITISIGVFWGVEIFKYRSHISETVDLATSGTYEVTSEFPLSNTYGNELCLSFEQSTHTFDISKLSYVSLTSETCSDITMTVRNETLYKNSPLQYSSYMFHWLRGTSLSIHAIVNGTSVVTIYLLNDRVSENYCSMHLQPENIVKKWMFGFTDCYLRSDGYMDCRLEASINSSGTYYICINTTIYESISYYINISSVVYNTSTNKMSLKCTQGDDCCLPFDTLVSEALHPTCMYISTQPLSPSFLGMKLVNVKLQVGQRLSVIRYCFILLLGLLLILGATVLFYLLTRYKAEHPNFDPRGCTVHCSIYAGKE